jgi:thioredoxin reductase
VSEAADLLVLGAGPAGLAAAIAFARAARARGGPVRRVVLLV